jgi:hypothetical protein
MSWRFWIKIEGCDSDTFSLGNPTYTAVELPILGILPTSDMESDTKSAINGREINRGRIRRVLEITCSPNSTWDYGTITTDNVLYLTDVVLQRKFKRLVAPTAPKVLPDRYRDTVNFPITSDLIPFVFARYDVSNEKQWTSGNERLVLTCYARDLV